LELERAQKMASGTSPSVDQARNRDLVSPPRSTFAQQQALNATANCDKCGESIPMMQFIQHSYECEIRSRNKSLAAAAASAVASAAASSPPPASGENRRPESASSSSAASVNDDARSATANLDRMLLYLIVFHEVDLAQMMSVGTLRDKWSLTEVALQD
jgi:hypothetical protein